MRKQQENIGVPLSLFISYAHEDEPLRQQLDAHLSLLRRQGLVADWYDRQIMPGEEWAQVIDEHLETAAIILLLVSSDFLASNYCYDKEMKRALERHKLGEARVIPIILRPCDWQQAPFARLQALPPRGKAVTEWADQDTAFRDIALGLRRVIAEYTGPVLSSEQRHNRECLLKDVRRIWIEGVLQPSLHQQALIALHLQDQPGALDNPFRFQVQETNRPSRLLPVGTSIVQVYDKAHRGLLILGKPGVGKTTLLLELARVLLERAEDDQRLRMPVYFNLSSWAEKGLPLSEWLIEELRTKYWITRTIAKAWVNTDQTLPLLDGLDEVAEAARPACVQAINTYCEQHQDKGPIPIVVCCRRKDYLALPIRIELSHAVSIRPLTNEQIHDYLQRAGNQLEALQQALQTDRKLCVLARYPLMLSIFTLAYQGARHADLQTEGRHEARLRQIFKTYVERMFSRRGQLKSGTKQQMLNWLTFLASQMQRHHQTVFLVEDLQPDWLPPRQQRLYGWNLRLVLGWLGGLVFGLVFGLSAGLLNGLIFMLSVMLVLPWLGRPLFWLLDWRTSRSDGGKIRPAEVISWSWKKVRMRLFTVSRRNWIYLMILTLSLVIRRIGGGFVLEALIQVTVVQVWLITGLIAGLSTDQLTDRADFSPNEGIRRSGKHGLLIALISWPIIGLLSFPFEGLLYGLIPGIVFSLQFGLLAALLIGLSAGGWYAFVRHFVLRMTLRSTKHLPWNIISFLDEATTRLLLHKVGGGYIFVHRLLLEYFATLETSSSENVSVGSTLFHKSGQKPLTRRGIY